MEATAVKLTYRFRCKSCGRSETVHVESKKIAITIAIRSGWQKLAWDWTCNLCFKPRKVTKNRSANVELNIDLNQLSMKQMLDLITLAQEAEKQIGTKFLREFGESVSKWRKDKALELDDLAKLIGGMTKASLEKLEAGQIDIPLSRLPRFCAVLDVDISDLLPAMKGKPSNAKLEPEPAVQEEEEEEEAAPADLQSLIYPKAVRVVQTLGQANIAILQRELKLGYSDAAKMIERMQGEGVITSENVVVKGKVG